MARSHSRGWVIEYVNGRWVYSDTGLAVGDRACRRCGRSPTADGHDACLGRLSGVESACCGHGVEAGYAVITEARTE